MSLQETSPKPGDHIGAIDCGSNAIRFSIYRLDDNLQPHLVSARRYPVRLGAGTFADGLLDPADIDAAVEAFREIKALAESHKVIALPAVATSAIREAANAKDLIDRIAAVTAIKLQPISGGEEADLIAVGVNATVQTEKTRAIFDIGGGSTEIIRCQPDGTILEKASLPLGAVRFAREAGMPDIYDDEDLNLMRDKIGQVLRAHFPGELDHGDYGIAIGGTARAIARFAVTQKFIDHEHKLTLNSVVESYRALIEMPGDEVVRNGIDLSRALIIVPGALILMGAMAFQGLEEAFVSDAGVREGLISRYLSAQPDRNKLSGN